MVNLPNLLSDPNTILLLGLILILIIIAVGITLDEYFH